MTTKKWIPIVVAAMLLVLPAAAEKQAPPAGGTPKDFKLPATRSFVLDNGLRVTFVQYGALPKVAVSVRLRSGNLNESAEQVWLADLVGDLMQEGTLTKNAEQLAAAFASMGGELSVSTGADVSSFGSDVLSEFGPRALALIAEVVRQPALPASEIDRLKADMARNLSIQTSQPGSQAGSKFAALIYGDHPYGRMFPTEEMIESYDAEAVNGFYAANFGAGRSHVIVVGKFDEAAMEQVVGQAFGDWDAGAEPLISVPKTSSRRAVHLIDRTDAPQSTLRIGLPVVDPSHPDYIPLRVTNTLLGGYFSSRITANIREDKGYTYSPGSSVSSRYRASHWVQSADVTTADSGAALKEIFYEIDRLRAEAPPAEELRGVQNYMAGIFVLRNSSRGGIVGQLAFVDLHGLSASYLTSYGKSDSAVTPEVVREMAEKYLRPEEMAVVVVGDRSQVKEQLRPYGKLIE